MECVGHFGHIELPVEVPHPLFDGKLLSAVAVPPTRMRLPNADHDAPLTGLLHRLLRAVDRYSRCTTAGDKVIASATDAVQLAVRNYYTSCPSSGAAGLCARMRGKQGTLRQTLMGWRVNSCARAVVAPDPYLAPWEVGVPGRIADVLGLREGDSVLLNRQPSLHRGSIMGHIVRLRPTDSCLSISPTVTPPYNADFDGDEMNLHITSTASSADARLLLGVEHSLLSPACGGAAVRLVQDACLSWYLRSGMNSAAQRATIVASCEMDGGPIAARRLHGEQLMAHDHMAARGFSVGLDDFLDRIPVTSCDRYTLGHVASIAHDYVRPTNRIAQMVCAGSKGSAVNLAQLFGCIGYQTVQGSAAQHPEGGSAFIGSSFVQGMSQHEFWMHASAAREGMIQTAVKTADTGYLMRRMVKSFENITVAYDDTVRTASGAVVQFAYGEDGIDPSTARFVRPRRIEPGEAVGVVCAQSIGERLTQLTLDTFHKAGVAFKHGILRVKALLDATARAPGVLRDADRPYRLPRYDLADAISSWDRVATLPARAALEMRMRGMPDAPGWRATLSIGWLAERGLLPWHVAARVREQCPCICGGDGCLYAMRQVQGIGGAEWAGGALSDSAVAIVSSPPLDTCSYPSEPVAVAACLGIEAAAVVLQRELAPYMQGVDPRHLKLLSDAMTYTGQVLGATRAGLRRADAVSVLGRACFETGPQVMAAAAEARATDPLHAASSRMALGLVPRIGCHAMEVLPPVVSVVRERPCSFMDRPVAKRCRFGNYMKD